LATAILHAADGATVATATLAAAGDAVELRVEASGLAPGPHGIHLHAIGKCEAPGFTSAGPHLNPGQKQHGHDNPMGAHMGDLPNLVVSPDGKGALVTTLPGSRAELEASLFDEDGTALVIHAGADDYRTDPSGNSGTRLACGVLERR
jgi:Cu-Zn family superoxide dismutase